MVLTEVGILFLVFGGLVFKAFPPKKINHIYGYRSRFAMKAQSIWDEGQRCCANSFIMIGIVMSVLGVLEYFLFRGIHAGEATENTIEFVEILLSIVAIYIHCETHLRKMFYEDGSRKDSSDLK